jgi:hypothetical protein
VRQVLVNTIHGSRQSRENDRVVLRYRRVCVYSGALEALVELSCPLASAVCRRAPMRRQRGLET